MYLQELTLEGVGPIGSLAIKFGFSEAGTPKPCVLVGENGSGKSILISHIVNALLAAKGVVFEDAETDSGKVYKLRSPLYIKTGKHHSFAELKFDNGLNFLEWSLRARKSEFATAFGYVPERPSWARIPESEHTFFETNANQLSEKTRELFSSGCMLYFPPDRAEAPAWLNIENLSAKAKLSSRKNLSNISGRNVIASSPMQANKDWLFDVIFDRQMSELKTIKIPYQPPGAPQPIFMQVLTGWNGPNSDLFNQVNSVIQRIFKRDDQFGVRFGARGNRTVSLQQGTDTVVPNIFQLSTGEMHLLNIFLSILRDSDQAAGIKAISEISGIVVIDEIDSNLHTSMQISVLPELIRLFPRVQFVISTHSPLVLLGLETALGAENVDIIEMPSGNVISAEAFKEFGIAYESYKSTNAARRDIAEQVSNSHKPIAYLEGSTDVQYLVKAAELLGRTEILERCALIDGDGAGNLDRVWKAFDGSPQFGLASKVLLVYDCDVTKQSQARNRISRFVTPLNLSNPIQKGVENLLPASLIERATRANPAFIDVLMATRQIERGIEREVPPQFSVNRAEKANLCAWVCGNGTAEEFAGFSVILDRIAELVST